MDELKNAKIIQFISDEAMNKAVFEVIQQSFLKARASKDVYYLAAKSLCLEFLDEAQADLNRYKENDKSPAKPVQVAL